MTYFIGRIKVGVREKALSKISLGHYGQSRFGKAVVYFDFFDPEGHIINDSVMELNEIAFLAAIKEYLETHTNLQIVEKEQK